VTIWIVAVMLKSNDILRKQTALKVSDCFVHFWCNIFTKVCAMEQ
jgi:hypothetical protein